MLRSWPSPGGEELALELGKSRGPLILILPAWFDESNKMRHFTVEVMRALDRLGVDSVLPDLPGCNESTASLAAQDIKSWRDAAKAAAKALGSTHVLTIRAGANIAPDLPGWAYAPQAAKSSLRALVRARLISAKEAGQEEDRETLMQRGMAEGLELAGYRLGPKMIAQMAEGELPEDFHLGAIKIAGAGLWLRMEPDHNAEQAEALAELVSAELRT